jgi:hypothetical protein
MAFVRVMNVTEGKLVFPAVRDAGDFPLTLEARETKDIHPSMASQPSFKAVVGTKVMVLGVEAPPVEKQKAVVAPTPVAVVETLASTQVTAVEEPSPATAVVEAAPAPVTAEETSPEESRTSRKPSKFRR